MSDIDTTIKRLEQLADDYQAIADQIGNKLGDSDALLLLKGVVIGMRRCVNELRPVRVVNPDDTRVDTSMGDLRSAIKRLNPTLKECPWCEKHELSPPAEYDWVNCINDDCEACGPQLDPHGHKWNSIPRRSEVAELLRLVDSVIDTPDWTRQDEVEELIRRADRLRKEWGLP